MNETHRSCAGSGEYRPAAINSSEQSAPLSGYSGLELSLSGSGLAEIMSSVLQKGAAFRFKAKGCSMWPFIRDQDILTISRVPVGKIGIGDVVAAVNSATMSVIVHRIVGQLAAGFMLKGDNCCTVDGVFTFDSVLGMVTTIEPGKKRVPFCNQPAGKLIACLSATGLLNHLILPLLRKIRETFLIGKSLRHDMYHQPTPARLSISASGAQPMPSLKRGSWMHLANIFAMSPKAGKRISKDKSEKRKGARLGWKIA